jgi:hypothetical protein
MYGIPASSGRGTLSFTLRDNQQRSKDEGFEESSAHDKISCTSPGPGEF